MKHNDEQLENLLKAYRGQQPQPSSDRLRAVLKQSPKQPRWRLWVLPAAAVAVLVLVLLPQLHNAKVAKPKPTTISSSATVDDAAFALTSAGASEQQIASSSSETPEFDSTDGLNPPSTIGDDF